MADTSGYKAMVYLYFNGGMDSFDTIIPYDQGTWDEFKTYRGAVLSSSRTPSNLNKLNPINSQLLAGREIGVPQELAEVGNLFEAGEAAIIGNVGPLAQPISDQDLANGTAVFPPRLGSHNDNASVWQTLQPEGAITGWGGKVADQSVSGDPTFAAITTGSTTPFLFGDIVNQFKAVDNSGLKPRAVSQAGYLPDSLRQKVGQYLLSSTDMTEDNLYAVDHNEFKLQGNKNSEKMLQARQGVTPMMTVFPTTRLGGALKLIAETIQVRNQLGLPRQVFFVNMGGFDSHRDQIRNLHPLQQQINDGVKAFRDAMVELGEWNNVALFTGSDFGRTLVSNGSGTDHAWGGHHFVFSGAVNGQRIYGDIPRMWSGHPRMTPGRGTLVPTISIEQYAATLAKWFGLTDQELDIVFPNLSAFPVRDLGFMG